MTIQFFGRMIIHMVGRCILIRYILLPLFIIAPMVSESIGHIVVLSSIPIDMTESASGVGPPNSELFLSVSILLLGLLSWFFVNAILFVPLAKKLKKKNVKRSKAICFYISVILVISILLFVYFFVELVPDIYFFITKIIFFSIILTGLQIGSFLIESEK